MFGIFVAILQYDCHSIVLFYCVVAVVTIVIVVAIVIWLFLLVDDHNEGIDIKKGNKQTN